MSATVGTEVVDFIFENNYFNLNEQYLKIVGCIYFVF